MSIKATSAEVTHRNLEDIIEHWKKVVTVKK